MQNIEIDWPFNAEPPEIFCPICSAPILKNGEELNDFCDHVEFVYLDEIGDFLFASKSIAQAVEDAREKAENDNDDDFEVIEFLDARSNPAGFSLALTTSGMACGPVSSTIRVGFDLAAGVE
jgi:hypothetical protein